MGVAQLQRSRSSCFADGLAYRRAEGSLVQAASGRAREREVSSLPSDRRNWRAAATRYTPRANSAERRSISIDHSLRSAISGSTRNARRAGSQAAVVATAANSIAAAANVERSSGVSPNSELRKSPASRGAHAPTGSPDYLRARWFVSDPGGPQARRRLRFAGLPASPAQGDWFRASGPPA